MDIFILQCKRRAVIEIEIEGRKECLTAFEHLLNPGYDNKMLIQRAEGHVIFWTLEQCFSA